MSIIKDCIEKKLSEREVCDCVVTETIFNNNDKHPTIDSIAIFAKDKRQFKEVQEILMECYVVGVDENVHGISLQIEKKDETGVDYNLVMSNSCNYFIRVNTLFDTTEMTTIADNFIKDIYGVTEKKDDSKDNVEVRRLYNEQGVEDVLVDIDTYETKSINDKKLQAVLKHYQMTTQTGVYCSPVLTDKHGKYKLTFFVF
ncbi:MAG TPA: hypothetical protein DDW20_03515 [Firmicutes bacterium]|nr:hypothetical protein [Bacillota bacterium]